MVYRIDYKRSVFNDIEKIDRPVAERIIHEIESGLAENPEIGEALTGQYKGLYTYRVGNWRVICSILSDSVLILRIRHRSVVYQ
ncbi:MAG TPA: type II toxin-antitoxin system mRNA interferase toxin, RelE/StbE family [Methanoregula sp.]|nr:type II toxin-antitoxin system mRNA interferase toxin, RelE/StbE family [Methanoregula sp.]